VFPAVGRDNDLYPERAVVRAALHRQPGGRPRLARISQVSAATSLGLDGCRGDQPGHLLAGPRI
jgi:hypothetical protein